MTRANAHAHVASALAELGDDALARALRPAGSGIGGTTATLELDGIRVFVKSVPLTDLELRDPHSTANLFGLPLHCQYGISSPGFGAWRELAVHQLTTAWVLAGACTGFPLLHHWRVVPRAADLTPAAQRDVDRQFAAWGDEAIRERFAARYRATSSLVLVLEHLGRDLRSCLGSVDLAMVERELIEITAFMNGHGLVHFDGHFQNILTDGHHLYFSDFGQASCDRFSLSPDERAFLIRHRDFDPAYVLTALTNATGDTFVARYGPIARVMNQFFAQLRTSKRAPYPWLALAQAFDEVGLRRQARDR